MTSEGHVRRGRPPKPLDPAASQAARLGAELRALRVGRGMTQRDLSLLTSYAPQHISSVELALCPCSRPFIEACDDALEAGGQLVRLLPAVVHEWAMLSHDRATARRVVDPALSSGASHSQVVGDDDVDPTNRRGLLGLGAATALGGLGLAAAPAAARDVDPELPGYWTQFLHLLGRHDAMFGPHGVLATVRHELARITEHRQIARGDLRRELLRVEARWSGFAAWLSEDTGRSHKRDRWTERALRLAREAGDSEMVSFARSRQSEWAVQERNAQRAIAYAQDALRVSGASAQTRAWSARQAALGYALANDPAACERMLADAYSLVELAGSAPPPWAGEFRVTRDGVLATEARCWLRMQPRKAIPLYEGSLREWPRDLPRDRGLHQARLALACASVGEQDRARDEGRKALALARATKSSVASGELKQLRETLVAN